MCWWLVKAPLYPPPPPERSMHPPPAFVINNTATDANVYGHHQQQQQSLIEDFPERPGQPECSYFLKTGDCKFRAACKYHHPKNRIPKSPPCTLSDKGLPLRPVSLFFFRRCIFKKGDVNLGGGFIQLYSYLLDIYQKNKKYSHLLDAIIRIILWNLCDDNKGIAYLLHD